LQPHKKMKQNALLIFIVGVLVAATIYSLYSLNKIQGKVNKTSNKLPEGERTADNTPKPAEDVTAGELATKLRDEMNKVSKISVTFNA
jgi:predicted Holliday junction resolvase-like endonuclease